MKYSKGDWKVEGRLSRSELGYNVDTIVITGDISGCGGRNIAEVGCWKDRENPEADADLIVTAVNACIELNRENPLAVAESIKDIYEALKNLVAPGHTFSESDPRYKDAIKVLAQAKEGA